MALDDAFMKLAQEYGALKFGEFTLKSGRVSPYFFNAGAICDGRGLAQLGSLYAQRLKACELDYDLLFGPAYKGIPLVSAVATALWREQADNRPYAFNRKEAKDHGEGGSIVGAPLAGQRIVLVDDVMTAGTAVRECAQIIADEGGILSAVIVALDRQERGQQGDLSAVEEVAKALDVEVLCVATFSGLIEAASRDAHTAVHVEAMRAYLATYGSRQ